MALATQCPHCHTKFRVASDQLKLRGGIVRCGACQSIFDGNAHLVDLERSPATTPAPTAAPELPASPPPPSAADASTDVDFSAEPVYTLDFGHTLDPLGILPKAEEPELASDDAPEAAPAPQEEAADAPRARVWRTGGSAAADAPESASAPLETPAPLPEPDAPPEPDTQPEPEALAEPATAPEPVPEALPEPAEPVPEPLPEPAPEPAPEPVPEPAAPPASAYAPQGRIEPSFDLPVDEELVAQPLPGDEHELEHELEPASGNAAHIAPAVPQRPATADDIPPAALPLRASAASDFPPPPPAAPKSARAKAVEARARRSRLTPTKIDAPKLRVPASTDPDEPEFVKRSRKLEASSRTRRILMGVGAVILLLVLAAQAVLGFGNVLAARYPGAKPALAAGCVLLRCRIELPRQADNLAIETGELQTLAPDTYSLNTLLRNQGSLVQAWPSIELELTDANDKPLLRRVFGPADYLPQGVTIAAGFGAHSEQTIRLNFALTELKPSGYHIAVFYP